MKQVKKLIHFLALGFIVLVNTAQAQDDDFLLKKHDNSQKEPDVEIDFIQAKKIHTHSKYKILSEFDPNHHKTMLWFNGFPVNEEITLSIRRLAQLNPENYTSTHRFTLLESGFLLDERKETHSHFCISSAGYLPGERIYCQFTTANGSFHKTITFIPNPIDIANSSGTILEAELISIKPTIYQVEITGLNEGEKFVFKSKTREHILEIVDGFSEDVVTFTFSPQVPGVKGGVSNVEFRRQSGKKYLLKFPWGNRLTEFLDKEKFFNAR